MHLIRLHVALHKMDVPGSRCAHENVLQLGHNESWATFNAVILHELQWEPAQSVTHSLADTHTYMFQNKQSQSKHMHRNARAVEQYIFTKPPFSFLFKIFLILEHLTDFNFFPVLFLDWPCCCFYKPC